MKPNTGRPLGDYCILIKELLWTCTEPKNYPEIKRLGMSRGLVWSEPGNKLSLPSDQLLISHHKDRVWFRPNLEASYHSCQFSFKSAAASASIGSGSDQSQKQARMPAKLASVRAIPVPAQPHITKGRGFSWPNPCSSLRGTVQGNHGAALLKKKHM